MSKRNLLRISHVPQGGGWEHIPPDLRVPCHEPGADRIGHRYVYGRLHWEKPAATITAKFDSFTRGKFGHPLEDRSLTLREGARLQSFPDEFVFCGPKEEVAAQIGNAIPPLLARALGTAILEALAARNGTHALEPSGQVRLF
jgi:DNA (cytosine-5)-methyltransferase 1